MTEKQQGWDQHQEIYKDHATNDVITVPCVRFSVSPTDLLSGVRPIDCSLSVLLLLLWEDQYGN